jgi:hypothetical protein
MKCCLRNALALMACVIAVLGFQSMVCAGMIAITNAGFEDPALADNGVVASVNNWILSGDSSAAVWTWNPKAIHYAQGGDGTLTGGDGQNVAEIFVGTDAAPGYLYQELATTLEAGKAYTLTVAYGASTCNTLQGGPVLLGIGTSAMPIGSYLAETAVDGSGNAMNQLVDATVTFTATADNGHLGESLRIYVANAGSNICLDFDNLRLSSAAVPEPGALAVLATGVIGLLCYAWRKHR